MIYKILKIVFILNIKVDKSPITSAFEGGQFYSEIFPECYFVT
nr:MAG TPA: hypothetical protein [Caudoviricetes sp.]